MFVSRRVLLNRWLCYALSKPMTVFPERNTDIFISWTKIIWDALSVINDYNCLWKKCVQARLGREWIIRNIGLIDRMCHFSKACCEVENVVRSNKWCPGTLQTNYTIGEEVYIWINVVLSCLPLMMMSASVADSCSRSSSSDV